MKPADDLRNGGQPRRRKWPWVVLGIIAAMWLIGALLPDQPTNTPTRTENCPSTLPAGEFTECLARRIERQRRAHCERLRAKPANQLTDADWRNLSRC